MGGLQLKSKNEKLGQSQRSDFTGGINHKLRIVAAGRGRSMCFPLIVQAVLDLVPAVPEDEKIQLVYLGTASYDTEIAFEAQTHAYKKLHNFNVTKLDLSEASDNVPTEAEIRKTLNAAHIIMSSGGNTLYKVNRWKALGVDKMIREIVETKNPAPVLCGGSAGAIIWFDHGHSDSMNPITLLKVDPNLTEEQKKDWSYIRVTGLGYVPAILVPHHDIIASNGHARSDDSNEMLLEYPELFCVGLDEACALVFHESQVRLVSADGIAGCYIKWVEHGVAGGQARVHSREFRETNGSIPLEHLLKGKFI